MDYTEYEQRYYGRIYGKRRARVVENQDPERRGRIRVENTEIYGASKSPWVMPCFPFYGGRDCGFFSVPPVGSLVWVEFEEGLVEYPIYTGGYFDLTDHHMSDGSPIEDSQEYQSEPSAAPAHARGDYDGSDFGDLKGRYGVPASSFEGDYGEVTVFQTKTGHRIEMDDTSGGERIQILHAKGAHIEILPDGSINIATDANVLTRSKKRTELVIDDSFEEIGGNHTSTVELDESRTVYGKSTKSVTEGVTFSSDSMDATISAYTKLLGGSLSATIDNLFEVNAGGDITLTSFGDMDLLSSGKGFMNFSNSGIDLANLVVFTEPTLSIKALNGTLDLSSEGGLTGSNYGVSMRSGSVGGQVYIGNFDDDDRYHGVVPLPTIGTKERVVMGDQLLNMLTALVLALKAYLQALSAGGITPGFGLPNPVLAAASTAASAALDVVMNNFQILPSPAPSVLLSDSVFVSKD